MNDIIGILLLTIIMVSIFYVGSIWETVNDVHNMSTGSFYKKAKDVAFKTEGLSLFGKVLKYIFNIITIPIGLICLMPISIVGAVIVVCVVIGGYVVIIPCMILIRTITYPLVELVKVKEKRRPYKDWFSKEVWYFIKKN